ncbi:glucose-methanol-choline oxidoreductase [Thozetella sp. PMI_491]|nr:glucose-methanol-choline oxidoreductase [Thozetella sp. PMI_491]
MDSHAHQDQVSSEYEYVIVGSGPGGGPLAANLARRGHSVLLLEAGDDQGLNLKEQVPAVFAVWEEDPNQRWDFFVKHYTDDVQAARDPKMVWKTPEGATVVGTGSDVPAGSKQLGIWYPRSGTLGGCAAHNAMVNVIPPDEDWEHIEKITGDKSWNPTNIRHLFERLEKCRYLPEGTPDHGFHGWLETNLAHQSTLDAFEPVIKSALQVSKTKTLIKDINGPHPGAKDGLYRPSLLMTKDGRRSHVRDYLVATANAKDAHGRKKYPLTIRTHCFATRVLFDKPRHGQKPKAMGVEFLEGASVYKADPRFSDKNHAVKRQVHARKEVIVAGGVFNTPQLLKLSGIGPKAELTALGIDVLVDLPGVGTNLQDNYEFSVVARAQETLNPFAEGTGLNAGDPLLEQWVNGDGPYTSNGLPTALLHTTTVSESKLPDLFIFGVGIALTGFFPGFSTAAFTPPLTDLSWDILKVRPRNNTGTVKLRSKDPRDTPLINFEYYSAGGEEDLTAMAEGVDVARRINAGVAAPAGPIKESIPGPDVTSDTAIKQSIKDGSFSHHAACTCPIGADKDPMACLDSKFRVRGVQGLRVVDASSFPRVPGSFPTTAIYILAEKATDAIIEDAVWFQEDKLINGARVRI